MPERRSVDPQARERARARLAQRRAQAAQNPNDSRQRQAARPSRQQGERSVGAKYSRAPRKRVAQSGRARRQVAAEPSASSPTSSSGVAATILRLAGRLLRAIGSVFATVAGFLWRAFRRLPGKAQVVVALVMLVVLVLAGRSCAASFAPAEGEASAASQPQAAASQDDSQAQAAQEPQTDFERMDLALLSDYLGEDGLDAFVEAAQKDDDVAWIGAHVRDYDDFGYEIQAKLLKLAASEPAAVGFVRNYVASAGSTDSQPCDPVKEGIVPALYQWDTRWAYADYSRSVIGLAGCGPTAMCMVYQGLTGQSDKSPYDFAMDAIAHDYVHSGTDAGFYVWEAESNGFSYQELDVSSSSLKKALNSGNVVICNVGPGDFTQVGHFIVLWGINDDGTLKVNDPYSKVRSEKAWDLDQVIAQTQALMSFGIMG
ncbi:MAG: papain-like cysteine protease family protein [Eggerthellales bacterium]|nr:papain-like cysteine protease family protein [Eggerthellales bacterium]